VGINSKMTSRISDSQRAIRFLNEYCVATELEQFIVRVQEGLARLIPGDCWTVGYSDSSDRKAGMTFSIYPANGAKPPPLEKFLALDGPATHPQMHHFSHISSARFLRLSDLIGRREWHEHVLYAELYRYVGGEDDLAGSFYDSEFAGTIKMTRGTTITSRERDLANSIVGPVLAGFRNAYAVRRLQKHNRLITTAVQAARSATIVANLQGKILTENPEARCLLLEYFGQEAFADRLPELLWRHVAAQRESLTQLTGKHPTNPEFRFNRNDRRLVVRLVMEQDGYILTLHNEGLRFDLDPLMRLGLSKREAEVLFFVAMGKTNSEVGIVLGISRLTVGKHMEHILQRLAVETRTAAAAIAIEARNSSA
jgi:DNA-binding CsgD family transcriptional regulator